MLSVCTNHRPHKDHMCCPCTASSTFLCTKEQIAQCHISELTVVVSLSNANLGTKTKQEGLKKMVQSNFMWMGPMEVHWSTISQSKSKSVTWQDKRTTFETGWNRFFQAVNSPDKMFICCIYILYVSMLGRAVRSLSSRKNKAARKRDYGRREGDRVLEDVVAQRRYKETH